MTRGRRTAAILLLGAALGLAALGQFYFFHRRAYLWDGFVLHGLAMACFLLAWRTASAPDSKTDKRGSSAHFLKLPPWLPGQPVRIVLMLLGLLSGLVASLLSIRRAWNEPTYDAVLMWLLAVGAVAASAVWPTSWKPRLFEHWKARFGRLDRAAWLEVVTVAAITLLALILRVAALDQIPYTVGGDEAWHGLLARQVLGGEIRNPFVMGYMSMPTFFYWPISWSLRFAGNNVAALRLPAALVGTLTLPSLYLLAQRLWGKRIALLSTLFLAAYDYHVHYSRLGANNVWDPLFIVLTVWLVDLGLTRSDGATCSRFFTLSGLVMGVSVYYYTGARLLPLLLVVYVAFVWLKRRATGASSGWPGSYAWPSLMLVLAFLVAGGPMLSYALVHPDDWNARINQVGIFQSGWLTREPELTGKTTLQILVDQFLRAAGAFHVFPDRTAWYGANQPLLGLLAGVFALLGMTWAIVHWRERRHFLLLVWFWSVILTGGILTESPPSSQRLVMAIPAVAILVALGLERTVALVRLLLSTKSRSWESIALGVAMAVLMVAAVRFYFIEYTPQRRYGSANGETATMMGRYLQELHWNSQAYLFGAPRLYWSFGTMEFLAPEVVGSDVVQPLDAPPSYVDGSQAAIFLFLPERASELTWVEKALPSGQTEMFYDADGELRFIAYRIAP